MSQLPHFLRVARSLAVLSALGTAGCASSVYPLDPDATTPDGDIVLADGNTVPRDTGLRANGCPRARPYPYGTACETPGLVCDPDACQGLVCRAINGQGAAQWGPHNVCNGPLPPPDLSHV